MTNPLVQMLINKAMNDPKILNTPMGQQFRNIVNSGNAAAGEELANNIIATMGIPRDQAIQQAQQGLFGNRPY